MRLSNLTIAQRGHLAYRLDHNTATGYITAGRIARGEFGDLDLVEVFRRADCTDHQAKILAAKARSFPPPGHPLTPEGKARLQAEVPRRRREVLGSNIVCKRLLCLSWHSKPRGVKQVLISMLVEYTCIRKR